MWTSWLGLLATHRQEPVSFAENPGETQLDSILQPLHPASLRDLPMWIIAAAQTVVAVQRHAFSLSKKKSPTLRPGPRFLSAVRTQFAGT